MTIHTAAVGGNMRQMNLAPFSVWSSVQKYGTGDLVVYSAAVWQASTDSIGNTPTSTSTGWTSVLSGGSPGGSAGQVQYNNLGAFGGFGNWDSSVLTIGSTSPNANVARVNITGDTAAAPGIIFLEDGRGNPGIDAFSHRGTIAAPTASLPGNPLFRIRTFGADSTGGITSAGIAQLLVSSAGSGVINSVWQFIPTGSDGGFPLVLELLAPNGAGDVTSPGANTTVAIAGQLEVQGTVFLPSLPTTTPAGSRQVWISSGVLAITP